MTSASSARQLGDEAHQYFFWLWAARMLAHGEIAEVGYETGDFRAFDDVAVRFASQRPDGLGGYYDEDHIQCKFSAAGGKVLTGEMLADPAFINADTFSLLDRLKSAVDQAETEKRRCLFRLWSPWPVEAGSLLDHMIDKTQCALRLNLLFEGKTANSKSGKLRKCWAKKLNFDMNDFNQFRRLLSPLRIEYDPRSLERHRLQVSDLLPLAGLRAISSCHRSDCYPVLIQRLHREGKRWFRSQDLIEACKQEGIWVGNSITPPTAKVLGIRTFLRFAEGLEDETDAMICLTQHFVDRHIRDTALWMQQVVPTIADFLRRNLAAGGNFRLRLPAVGSVAFITGYLAEPKLGAQFEIAQAGVGGTQFWACGASDGQTDEAWHIDACNFGRGGDELTVAISVTHSTRDDAIAFANGQLPAVDNVLHLSLSPVGQGSLNNGGHAFRAAQQAILKINQYRNTLAAPSKIHLLCSAPNGFTFMLGQLSRTLGRIQLYEFDFESNGRGRYRESLSLDPSIRL